MDVYDESRKLADALSKKNECSISQEILDAINYSSTGTEILMKLRFCLGRLVNNNQHVDSEIRILVNKILIEINQLIK